MKSRPILIGSLLLLAGCATGRMADLGDCAKLSVGVGPGLGADLSLGVVSHPAIGVMSSTHRVGIDGRSVMGSWSEREVYSPLANVGARVAHTGSANASYFRSARKLGATHAQPVQYEGRWINFSSNPREPLFRRLTDFQLGLSALLVSGRVGVNPLECLDLVLGFVGLDIAHDDRVPTPGQTSRSPNIARERVPIPEVERRCRSTVPPEAIEAFLALAKAQDFRGMWRAGEATFPVDACIPDHAERFGAFPADEPVPGQVRYVFCRFKSPSGAGSISLFLEAATGRIVMFSPVEAIL